MSKSKRLISFLIVALMLVGLMPFGTSADEITVVLPSVVIMKVDDDGNPVGGAVFEMREISGEARTIGTTTSGEDGLVIFNDVEHGHYEIQEIIPPEGYYGTGSIVYADVTELGCTAEFLIEYYSSYCVFITPEGAVVQLTTGESGLVPEGAYAAIVNTEIPKTDIIIKKVNEEGEPLSGGVFGFWRIVTIDYEEDTYEFELMDTTEAVNGIVRFEGVMSEYGRIKEVAPPEGYLGTEDEVFYHFVYDENEEGEMLIYITYYSKNVIEDESGFRVFKSDLIHIVGEEDCAVGYAALVNKALPDIVVMKVDKEGEPVSGGEFELLRVVEYDDETDEYDTELVATAQAVNGFVRFERVEDSLYIVREKVAPYGYLGPEDEIIVNIEFKEIETEEGDTEYVIDIAYYADNYIEDEEGFTVYDKAEIFAGSIVGYAAFVNEKLTFEGSIKVGKIDENEARLKGAKIGLYDYAGNLLKEAVTGEDGVVLFEELLGGTYKLREIQAPEGFKLFTGEIEVELTAEKPDRTYVLENAKEDSEELGSWEETELPPYDSGDLPEAGGTPASVKLFALGTVLTSSGIVLGIKRRKKSAKI